MLIIIATQENKNEVENNKYKPSPSETTIDLVELSDIIGGRRTCNSTSAAILLVTDISTWHW